MEKKDFYIGQTVYVYLVYLVGNVARYKKTINERIEEWEVSKVGTKYITCKSKINPYEEKFDIKRNFQHVYKYGSVSYILYLRKEDIINEIQRKKNIERIQRCCSRNIISRDYVLNKVSDEDLKSILDILMKYNKGECNEKSSETKNGDVVTINAGR